MSEYLKEGIGHPGEKVKMKVKKDGPPIEYVSVIHESFLSQPAFFAL